MVLKPVGRGIIKVENHWFRGSKQASWPNYFKYRPESQSRARSEDSGKDLQSSYFKYKR